LLALITGVRSPILLSIALLVACAVGACGRSLSPSMSGTGGTPEASGGFAGESFSGTGGLGSGGAPGTGGGGGTCSDLSYQYLLGLTAARKCVVGASGQCQQFVSGAQAPYCICPGYVNDTSALTAITDAYQAAGCGLGNAPCVVGCPSLVAGSCVSVDGGTVGSCASLPVDGGGVPGTDGGVACSDLAAQYESAYAAARKCTAGASGQCLQVVSGAQAPGCHCPFSVNDSTALTAITAAYQAAGCGLGAAPCMISCPASFAISCFSVDGGFEGVCEYLPSINTERAAELGRRP
jgi:hypothetical protein